MKGIKVSDPQGAILESLSQRNLFLSGTGSGKSHCIGLLTADIIINYPNLIQFIGANTYAQLSKATLKRVFEVWENVFGWRRDIHYKVDCQPDASWPKLDVKLKSYDGTIVFNNGAMLFTASLDNYKAIDGTEFAIAYLDETKDTKEEAVKEVIINRLRQPGLWVNDGRLIDNQQAADKIKESGGEITGFNPLYVFTSPAKVDWLYKWFKLTDHYEEIAAKIFSKTDFFQISDPHRCVVISSTYHNEENLSDGYIDNLLRDYEGNQEKIDIFIYGSPIAKTGGEYAYNFKRTTHIVPVSYQPNLPIHSTFDFNGLPYSTNICSQVEVNTTDKIIYWNIYQTYPRHGIKTPKSTEELSEQILSELTRIEHKSGLFIYGDASGENNNSMLKEVKHHYSVINTTLFKYLNDRSYRVLKRNPPLNARRDFLNKILNGSEFFDGYRIIVRIDPSNDILIEDLEFCPADKNGHKDKSKTGIDPITGNKFEKYGHFLDALEYCACALFADYFKTFAK